MGKVILGLVSLVIGGYLMYFVISILWKLLQLMFIFLGITLGIVWNLLLLGLILAALGYGAMKIIHHILLK